MAGSSITFEGTFDLPSVMGTIKDWMESHEYGYFEPKQSHGSKRVSFKAEGDRKVDEYAKLALEVDFSASGLKVVEMIKDQQKVKRTQGQVTIKIKGKVELDYAKDKKFPKDTIWSSIKNWAHDTFMSHRIGEYHGMMEGDVDGLTRALRAALEMSV